MERRGIRDLHLFSDLRAADWVVGGVESFGELVVGSLVPRGFEGYARLFHPAYHSVVAHPAHPAHSAHYDEAEVRWDTVAAATGRQAHAGMQWPAIAGTPDDDIWDEEPEAGSLPIAQAAPLLAVLQGFTTSDDCFYAVWEGFGGLAVPLNGPRVEMPARPMVLLHGPLADAAEVSMGDWPWQQSPSLWWPEDRAWCVATDVDQTSTYVGASRACLDALIATSALEVWPVRRDQDLTVEIDLVNAG